MKKFVRSLTAAIVHLQYGRTIHNRGADRRQARGRWFTWDEYAVVAALAELIVPPNSHGSGAKDARVMSRLDSTMASLGNDREEYRFAAGLIAFDKLAVRRCREEFVFLDRVRQQELFEEIDQAGRKLNIQGGTIHARVTRAACLTRLIWQGYYPAVDLVEPLRDAVLDAYCASKALKQPGSDSATIKLEPRLVFRTGSVGEFWIR